MILHYILDIIFPPKRSLPNKVCSKKLAEHLREKISPIQTPGSWIHSGYEYQDPDIKKLILHLKKFRDIRVAKALSERLHDQLIHMESEHRTWNGEAKTILVPIPLHPYSQRKRGFNQSLLMAEKLSKGNQHRTVKNLIRAKEIRPKQALLRRKERLENLNGVFVMRKKHTTIPQNHLVVIIDDVTTTGATLHEARLQFVDKVPLHNLKALTIAH